MDQHIAAEAIPVNFHEEAPCGYILDSFIPIGKQLASVIN